jgi:DNA invertase Pin-like site-specific DNA recombinase
MAFCANCGHQLSDTVAFCTRCGTARAAQPKIAAARRKGIPACSDCGHGVSRSARRCPNCGAFSPAFPINPRAAFLVFLVVADQDLDIQVAKLLAAGCDERDIYRDKASGGSWDRPQWEKLLYRLQPGDVVVVYKLDRLSRSLKDLVNLLEDFRARGIGFHSLTENIDTTSAMGEMVFHMVAAFAQFERALIRERTKAGLENAKRNGKKLGGRRHKRNYLDQRAEVVRMIAEGRTAADCARLLGMHRSTIGQWLEDAKRDRERLHAVTEKAA